jgi:two-component system sensor histidine kinase RegB
MAILTKEMQHDQKHSEILTAQLRLLRAQIDRCKEILSRMAARAGQLQANAGRSLALRRYLEELLSEWKALRPQIPFQVEFLGPSPGPRIVTDRTLSQALLNILNNAADAATDRVSLKAEWDDRQLSLTIHDDGYGLPESLRSHLGQAFVTTKPPGHGLGLGLYLARTTLERLGGGLTLNNAPPRGVCASITLPLDRLLTTEPEPR